MTIRIINGCNKWGMEQGHINSFQRIKGGSDYDPRDRVLSQDELETLFDGVTPYHFNQFVRFAYYTGARSGEIRRLSRVKINCDYMLVEGKSGRRAVKLASQARKILEDNPSWDYTANYVQFTWVEMKEAGP